MAFPHTHTRSNKSIHSPSIPPPSPPSDNPTALQTYPMKFIDTLVFRVPVSKQREIHRGRVCSSNRSALPLVLYQKRRKFQKRLKRLPSFSHRLELKARTS